MKWELRTMELGMRGSMRAWAVCQRGTTNQCAWICRTSGGNGRVVGVGTESEREKQKAGASRYRHLKWEKAQQTHERSGGSQYGGTQLIEGWHWPALANWLTG